MRHKMEYPIKMRKPYLQAKRTMAWMLCASAVFSTSAMAQEVPDNLVNFELNGQILSDISTTLPEQYQVNADFLNPSYDPNLSFSEDSQVAITFVSEGAGYRNSLGYYTYEDGAFDGLTFGDIDTNSNGNIGLDEILSVDGVYADLIFSNASAYGSGGQLRTGDTTVLGGGTAVMDGDTLLMSDGAVFGEGTNMGFFLSANAWTGRSVKGWDARGESNNYYTMDFLNPENSFSATLDNPDDMTRHVAMGFADESQSEIIIGFEDLNRYSGDNDFNDAVFIVRSDPISGIAGTQVTTFSAPSKAIGGLPVVGAILGTWALGRRRKTAHLA